MKWIHLSDIHFEDIKFSINKVNSLEEQNKINTTVLREELLFLIAETKVDFIVITGDIFYQNKCSSEMIDFSYKLKSICGSNISIYMTPGNHDVNTNNYKRKKYIEKLKNSFFDSDIIKTYGYEKFCKQYEFLTQKKFENYIVINNKDYRIISLNSSLLYERNKKTFKLYNKKLLELSKEIRDDNKINILITHYGIDMLEENDALNFQRWADKNHIDIVCCGHNHRPSMRTYDYTNNEIKQFTCGAIKSDEYCVPSFYLFDLDKESWEIKVSLYEYSLYEKGGTSKWVISNTYSRNYMDGCYYYKVKRKFELLLSSEYKKMVNLTFEEMKKNLNSNFITLAYEIVYINNILRKTEEFDLSYVDYKYTVDKGTLISKKIYKGKFVGSKSTFLFPFIMASNTGNTSEEIEIRAYDLLKNCELEHTKGEVGTYIWENVVLVEPLVYGSEFEIEIEYRWKNSFALKADYVLVSPNYVNKSFNTFNFELCFNKEKNKSEPVVLKYLVSRNGCDKFICSMKGTERDGEWSFIDKDIAVNNICFYVYIFHFRD